jgi:hypothetical protein
VLAEQGTTIKDGLLVEDQTFIQYDGGPHNSTPVPLTATLVDFKGADANTVRTVEFMPWIQKDDGSEPGFSRIPKRNALAGKSG